MDARDIGREFKKLSSKLSINASNRRGYITKSMIERVRDIASVTQPKLHPSGKIVLRKAV